MSTTIGGNQPASAPLRWEALLHKVTQPHREIIFRCRLCLCSGYLYSIRWYLRTWIQHIPNKRPKSYTRSNSCGIISTMEEDLSIPPPWPIAESTQSWSTDNLVNTDKTHEPKASHLLPSRSASIRRTSPYTSSILDEFLASPVHNNPWTPQSPQPEALLGSSMHPHGISNHSTNRG